MSDDSSRFDFNVVFAGTDGRTLDLDKGLLSK